MKNKYTILIPHWRTGKMTAYCLSKLIQHSKGWDVRIIVVDNSFPGPSIGYLQPFLDKANIDVMPYPEGQRQSHGIAFAYALEEADTEYFITVESDSFPTKDGWLAYYDKLIDEGYDAGGSFMKLSGGEYMHPAGAFYRKSVYEKAAKYLRGVQYHTLPAVAHKDGFNFHLMIRQDVYEKFCANPASFGIELPELHYKNADAQFLLEAGLAYRPALNPFHTIYGQNDEVYATYGQRSTKTEPQQIIQQNDRELIFRIGFEPGQWFCYWLIACGYKLAHIPTEIVWMKNRIDQQQEYTLAEHGFRHIWGVTAYASKEELKAQIGQEAYSKLEDIIEHKSDTLKQLYKSLPENERINEESLTQGHSGGTPAGQAGT